MSHQPKSILLLSGAMGTGKDTVADAFVTRRNFVKLAYADKLKEHLANLFGFPVAWCYSEEGKKQMIPHTNMTVARGLQVFGTDCIRDQFDPDFWVRSTCDRIEHLGLEHVVIPDCRFPNELDFVRDRFSRVPIACFVLARSGINRNDGREGGHASEVGYREILAVGEGYAFELPNNSTIEDLQVRALRTFDEYLKSYEPFMWSRDRAEVLQAMARGSI